MPELPMHPNLVLIVTDQERAPMHWPEGCVEERLVSRSRLLRHGLSFENAVCDTSMCSPSRATFLTGVMPAQHRVVDTLTADGPVSCTETELSRDIPNLASMLQAAGYDVHYRGKWHLRKGPTGGYDATPEDLAAYGFDGWVAPDAGGDTCPPNFGGGRADHDAAYIAQAVSFLRERAAHIGGKPFCLVVSLVNPHDLLAFPREWTDDYTPDWLEGDVELPPSFEEDLSANFKPSAHAMMGPAIDRAVGKFATLEQREQYVNFYANLVARIDRQIASIIDCFYGPDDQPTELGEETLIVRFSDHGELAMAHGGLRQKAFNVYEESLRVPLIFSNPRLVPDARACPHPASLVDIMPTLASLLEVDPPPGLRGTDLVPLVKDPEAAPVQEEVLFTFDDMHAGTGLVREVRAAGGRLPSLHVRDAAHQDCGSPPPCAGLVRLLGHLRFGARSDRRADPQCVSQCREQLLEAVGRVRVHLLRGSAAGRHPAERDRPDRHARDGHHCRVPRQSLDRRRQRSGLPAPRSGRPSAWSCHHETGST